MSAGPSPPSSPRARWHRLTPHHRPNPVAPVVIVFTDAALVGDPARASHAGPDHIASKLASYAISSQWISMILSSSFETYWLVGGFVTNDCPEDRWFGAWRALVQPGCGVCPKLVYGHRRRVILGWFGGCCGRPCNRLAAAAGHIGVGVSDCRWCLRHTARHGWLGWARSSSAAAHAANHWLEAGRARHAGSSADFRRSTGPSPCRRSGRTPRPAPDHRDPHHNWRGLPPLSSR